MKVEKNKVGRLEKVEKVRQSSRSENELPKRRYRVVAKSPGRFVDVKR